MTESNRRTIKVSALARVEGEGGLYVRVKDEEVKDVRLNIFEPPRFFEAFLRGRRYAEAPDITARICGICPVAYQMSSIHAMEDALGIRVGDEIRSLRRLIYCGEWIESHTLHVYMLHAPDFLGYESAIHMAKDHPDRVEQGLTLKKIGNEIVSLIGGREIHPVNLKVGGFYRAPRKKELMSLVDSLKRARDIALDTVQWVSTFTFPEIEYDYEFVALRHPDEYPMNDGRLISNKGLDIQVSEYERHFSELHVGHSSALHSLLHGERPYFVGPLARYNLNLDRLTPLARDAAAMAGIGGGCLNPFKSIIVRAVEVLYACEEALRIIEGYEGLEEPCVDIQIREGRGCWCTEAPRGILYHRYEIDSRGDILSAKIVPPTSQNQKTIEIDLKEVVSRSLDLPDDELTWRCEQTIRNYDPCISCATHFLKIEIDRE